MVDGAMEHGATVATRILKIFSARGGGGGAMTDQVIKGTTLNLRIYSRTLTREMAASCIKIDESCNVINGFALNMMNFVLMI